MSDKIVVDEQKSLLDGQAEEIESNTNGFND